MNIKTFFFWFIGFTIANFFAGWIGTGVDPRHLPGYAPGIFYPFEALAFILGVVMALPSCPHYDADGGEEVTTNVDKSN